MGRITMHVESATKNDNPSLLFNDDDLLEKFYEENKKRSVSEILNHGGLFPVNLFKNIYEYRDTYLGCSHPDMNCSDCKLRIYEEKQIDERLAWISNKLNRVKVYTDF